MIITQTKSLDELFEIFVKQSKNLENKSNATIRNYRDSYELLKNYSLRSFNRGVELSDLKPELIINFFTDLNERERKIGKILVVRVLKNSSIETIRGKLNSFFSWLILNKYLAANPFEGMKHSEVIYDDKRAFTKEEVDKIFLAVSRDIRWETPLLKIRNEAMIMELLYTGIRKEEHLGLLLTDFDFANYRVTIRAEISKSKRTRILALNSALVPWLEKYLDARKDYKTPYFWVSNNEDRNFTEHGIKHFVERLKKETDIHIHLHRFRHTFAVNMYLQTRDILAVMKAMGHRSIKQTMSYLRSIPDDEYLRQMERIMISEFV